MRPAGHWKLRRRATETVASSGLYHSHPTSGAPSQYDLDLWPVFSSHRFSPRVWRQTLLGVSQKTAVFEMNICGRFTNGPRHFFDEDHHHMQYYPIPTPLRLRRQKESVEVSGNTVGELLADLTKRHEGLKKHLYADDGRLRNFVNVYLNDEDIRYLQREQTPVKAGDSLSIVPSVAGGIR